MANTSFFCLSSAIISPLALPTRLHPSSSSSSSSSSALRASSSSSSAASDDDDSFPHADIHLLDHFIRLNIGSWNGSFTQYDAFGNVLHCIPTRLAADCYGKGELASLCQTLNIKMPPPKTFISGEEDLADKSWAEYKLAETNLRTIDRRQQVGFFPEERAYTASHQTAEMLDKVLRAGVLGEDVDDEEEFPVGLKLPSRRPALVCEGCLFEEDENSRWRAFHVVDSRGLIDTLGIFHERKEDYPMPALEISRIEDRMEDRLDLLLGRWSGRSVTRRTGLYGSTIAEEDVEVVYRKEDDGTVVQDILTPGKKMQLTGKVSKGLIKFDKGLHMTLLPGRMALAFPVSVGQSVGKSQSFYLEFSRIYSPGRRRRLVRTYDMNGSVVSTTFVHERKL